MHYPFFLLFINCDWMDQCDDFTGKVELIEMLLNVVRRDVERYMYNKEIWQAW